MGGGKVWSWVDVVVVREAATTRSAFYSGGWTPCIVRSDAHALISSGGGGQVIRQFLTCGSQFSCFDPDENVADLGIVCVDHDLISMSPRFRLVLEFGDVDREHDRIHCQLSNFSRAPYDCRVLINNKCALASCSVHFFSSKRTPFQDERPTSSRSLSSSPKGETVNSTGTTSNPSPSCIRSLSGLYG